MEEADQLCQRIAIVDHGKMLALILPEIKDSVPGGYSDRPADNSR